MDPNWIMAIIAISAIFSPAIVSILENIYTSKNKKLELKSPKQQEILSNFVEAALKKYNTCNFNDVIKFDVAKNNLYIYFQHVPSQYISNLETYNDNQQLDKYEECINLIVQSLAEEIERQ